MQSKHNKQLVPLAKQLRKEMTKEERHLWYDFLRSYPVRFSRQKVLGKYIADFYSAEAKLVIELDGSQHYEDRNIKQDADRTAFLEGYGLSVIRIPNNEVGRNFCGVCAYIDAVVRQSLSRRRSTAILLIFCRLRQKDRRRPAPPFPIEQVRWGPQVTAPFAQGSPGCCRASA